MDSLNLDPSLLLVAAPAALGYTASWMCPVPPRVSGNYPSFTPPGWVFGVVWPVLYLLLGLSWQRNARDPALSSLYALVVALLTAWAPVSYCASRPDAGIWIMVVAALVAGYCMVLGSTTDRLMVLPLVAWLAFATVLAAAGRERVSGAK
jgi:tryptophan-rich sensory protein